MIQDWNGVEWPDGMVKCVCAVCGRTVNGRVPATSDSGLVVPYRHLPPGQLGGDRFLYGRWCAGSWEPAKRMEGGEDG